jgi:hypothetical protein
VVVEDKHTPEGMVSFSRTAGTRWELMEGGVNCRCAVWLFGLKGDVRDARPNGSRTGDREMNGGGLNLGGMLKCVRKGIAMGME